MVCIVVYTLCVFLLFSVFTCSLTGGFCTLLFFHLFFHGNLFLLVTTTGFFCGFSFLAMEYRYLDRAGVLPLTCLELTFTSGFIFFFTSSSSSFFLSLLSLSFISAMTFGKAELRFLWGVGTFILKSVYC